MKLIQELLEMAPGTYEKMVINHYHKWCTRHGFDDVDVQKLIANAALFAWWLEQYQKQEWKFSKRAIEFFGKADRFVLRAYNQEHVTKVDHLFSRSLLRAARKQKPITPQYN